MSFGRREPANTNHPSDKPSGACVMILHEFNHIGPLEPDHRPGFFDAAAHIRKDHSRDMAPIIQFVNISQAAFEQYPRFFWC
jgi:hypothetical protein